MLIITNEAASDRAFPGDAPLRETPGLLLAGIAPASLWREKTEEINPDVILIDSPSDGLYIAEEILRRLPCAKIVFLSGGDEPEYIRRALTFRSYACAEKPRRGKDGAKDSAADQEIRKVLRRAVAELDEERGVRIRLTFAEEGRGKALPPDSAPRLNFGGQGAEETDFFYPADKEDALTQSPFRRESDAEIFGKVKEFFNAMETRGCSADRMYLETVCLLKLFTRRASDIGMDVYAFYGEALPNPIAAHRLCRSRQSLEAWLFHVLRACRDEMQKTATNHTRSLIARAHAFMLENYCTYGFSLNMAAEHLKLNPSYFSRMYKKETQTSFTEALTDLRMRKAISLLRDSDEKISEIAHMVGYPSEKYFAALFKKQYGCSPVETRERGNAARAARAPAKTPAENVEY